MKTNISDGVIQINQQSEKVENINIILFLAGKLISLLGTNIYNFMLSLYILKVTGSATSFAISLMMGMLPRVIFGPFAGSIADRIERKKIVVGLDLLSGIVVLSLMGISTIYGLRIFFIYFVNLLLAIISTFFDTAISASIPNLVSDKKLMKIYSYDQAVGSFCGIVGFMLGGVIYALLPIRWFLLINSISFMLSGVLAMFINFRFNKPENINESDAKKINARIIIEDFKDIMGFIRKEPVLFTIVKYAIMINFLIDACMGVLLPFLINNVLKMSPFQYGIIEAAFPIGVMATSIVLSKLPEQERALKLLSTGLSIDGLLLILLGIPAISFISSINTNVLFIYYIIAMTAFAAFIILVNVPMNVKIQRLIPDEIRGRIMGVLNSITGCVGPLGVILAGLLTDIVPIYLIFIMSGAQFLFSAFMLFRNKNMKAF